MSFDPVPTSATNSRTNVATAAERWLCCSQCLTPITRETWLVVRAGNAAHRFRNPAGEAFHLRCFARAPGADAHGEPTAHFTWFPGYQWQIALCGTCQTHLGWHYVATESTFWGLITDKLTQPE